MTDKQLAPDDVAAFTPGLERYLRRHLPAGAVEDVRQEVWVSVWAAPRALGENAAALVHRVAERRVADWHRGQRAAVPLLPEDPAANAPADDPDLLCALLQSAEVQPATLLWHRIVDDWSIDDLARWADIPAGTVKSRLSHQTQALRRRLYDWREGPPYRRPRVREFAERACPPISLCG